MAMRRPPKAGTPAAMKEFVSRLEKATERHPDIPIGHGRQKWIRDKFQNRFGVKVSPWTVGKWFNAESQPRRERMQQLALILDVDIAWLSLGLAPGFQDKEVQKINATAPGVVNIAVGIFQIAGGQVAISDSSDDGSDFIAIFNGRQYKVTVCLNYERGNEFHLMLPDQSKGLTVLGVVPSEDSVVPDFIYLTEDMISRHSRRLRGKNEISVQRKGRTFQVGDDMVAPMRSLNDLEQ